MATYYWVGGTGTWNNSSSTNWSLASGGAGGAGVPNNTDTVIFDANSGVAATVTVASTAAALNCTVNKSDIVLSLSGSAQLSGASSGIFTLTQGSVQLNTFTLTLWVFSSNNTNARTINFGTGKFVLQGNAATIWQCADITNMTVSGTPLVECTYSGATGKRGVFHGSTAGNETNAISLSVLAGSDEFDFFRHFANVNFTGFTGSLTNNNRTIYGNLTVGAGMTYGGAVTTTFAATSGPKTITTNSVPLDNNLTFNGIGGSWRLSDSLTVNAARTFTLTNGTFDANSQNVTLGSFALGAGTKTLTLGSGTWTVAASGTAWNANTNVTGLTVSASTGRISMTSASSKTFAGGAQTWPTLSQSGSGALTIQQSNTFTNIINTVQPATVTLTSGTTQTVTNFTLSGTPGNLITLNSSTPGAPASLSDSSGNNTVSYVSIQDINATGGAYWEASTFNGNVDAGNNLGWNFSNAAIYGTLLTPALRSFTERKQF